MPSMPMTQLEREQILTNAMRHLSQERKVELLFSLSKLEQYENESFNDDSSVGSLSSTISSLAGGGFLATQSKTTRRTIIKCLRRIGEALQVSEWRKNMAWQKHEMMDTFTLREFLSTRLKIALSMEHTELLTKTFDKENRGEVNVYDLLEERYVFIICAGSLPLLVFLVPYLCDTFALFNPSLSTYTTSCMILHTPTKVNRSPLFLHTTFTLVSFPVSITSRSIYHTNIFTLPISNTYLLDLTNI